MKVIDWIKEKDVFIHFCVEIDMNDCKI